MSRLAREFDRENVRLRWLRGGEAFVRVPHGGRDGTNSLHESSRGTTFDCAQKIAQRGWSLTVVVEFAQLRFNPLHFLRSRWDTRKPRDV